MKQTLSDPDRRAAFSEGWVALAAIFATTGAANAAHRPKKPEPKEPTTSLVVPRTYTDAQGKTHCGTVEWKGVPVKEGENSIVPAGCTRYYEGTAISMLIRCFVAGMKTDYHTDPANQHQVTFMIDGEAAVGAKDGTSFQLRPGDWASVEDDHGEGHTAVDATGKGFTQLFVAVPAVPDY